MLGQRLGHGAPASTLELAEAMAEIARLQKKTEMLLTRTVELQDKLLRAQGREGRAGKEGREILG